MIRSARWSGYAALMRLDKPIGIYLLLWPTLWALWWAAQGMPSWQNLLVFSLGVVVMRSAGCVINDFADRRVDGRVQRTQARPLVTGAVSVPEALILFFSLLALAFVLVLTRNSLTIQLAFVGAGLASIYPFMKRYTHLPQVVLGAAFAWAIPMAFAAQTGQLPGVALALFALTLCWVVAYDTIYALADREDDKKVGIKSTAILFGRYVKPIVALLQAVFVLGLWSVGSYWQMSWIFEATLLMVIGCFVYQHWLIRDLVPAACMQAFFNNHYVGMLVFVAIALHYVFAS